MALWGLLACGCAATKPKAKVIIADLPLIDANKMKKIEVIHLAPADTDKPEDTPVEPGLKVQLDDDDVEDARQLPEPGSASSTAPQSTPTSTDKAGEEAAPT
ncbi:MAG: hypothetical protein VB934_22010, partial [Polyangiaceae bacterium]